MKRKNLKSKKSLIKITKFSINKNTIPINISIIEENVSKIRSVSQFLEQRMTPQEISLKVLEKTEPNLLHEQEVKYHCGCGKDRVRKMLLGLGEDELRRMVFEGKPVEVKCHFCEKVHIFYVDELKRMLEFCCQEGKKC